MKLLYQSLSARTSRVTECLQKPPDLIRLLCFLTLAGVAAGAVFGDCLPPDTALLTQGLAVTDRLRTLWDAYLAALLPHLLLLAGVRLSGSSACGQPAAAALLLLRGAAVGSCAADCMRSAGGFLRAAVCVLPMGFLSSVILVYAAADALRLSGRLGGYLLLGGTDPEIRETFHRTSVHMLVYLLLSLAAAGVHTALLWAASARL